jgi:DNA-binding transcriptional MerR regulator
MSRSASHISPRELAGLFGVGPSTVRLWARHGLLDPPPERTPSGRLRWPRSEVPQLVARVRRRLEVSGGR